MERWPHQTFALTAFLRSAAAGRKRILLTSPTGGGKTNMVFDIAKAFALDHGEPVALFTNRKLMIEQLGDSLAKAGYHYGVCSAGHAREESLFQIVSMQTTTSRGLDWLPPAKLVIIDECHLYKSDNTLEIQKHYMNQGATWLGITATPIDLGYFYDELITAGNNSELRKCGALVKAVHIGPDEPDLKAYKADLAAGKDISEQKQRTVLGQSAHLFGRVFKEFERLNPQHKPTLLFAAGVAESLWFAQEFSKRGVPAAHIDGQDVWMNGELQRTSPEAREKVLRGSREGTIPVICNRFILREGIDAPWLQHGIFACCFGSLQSYIQSGGRLLRTHPGVDTVCIQDHGGNWHRHGSLNADRRWSLDCTAAMLAGWREERIRAKLEPEPFRCPKCAAIMTRGPTCKECGFAFSGKRSRPVVMSDGEIKEQTGDIYPERKRVEKPDTQKRWTQSYFQAKASKNGMTFRQAEGLFAHKWHYWPVRTLMWMPREPFDWVQKVADVPRERLL